jgi:hypothetical protein
MGRFAILTATFVVYVIVCLPWFRFLNLDRRKLAGTTDMTMVDHVISIPPPRSMRYCNASYLPPIRS